jgi:hypothetical protein
VLTDCGLVAGMMALDLCAGDGWFTLPMAHGSSRGSDRHRPRGF